MSAARGVDCGVGLAQLRQTLGATQADVARELGASQPGVLKLERSSDPRLSTLCDYVDALGRARGLSAGVTVTAVVGDAEYRLGPLPAVRRVAGARDETPMATRERSDVARGAAVAWRLRAWDDVALEQRFLDESVIAMSDDELGDLTDLPSDAVLAARLRAAYPERTPQAIGTFVRYWHAFRDDMRVGDAVAVPLAGRRVAIGVVTGDYEYRGDEHDRKMRHRRSVRWCAIGLDRRALDEDLRRVVNAPGTICRFRSSDATQRLLGAAEGRAQG